MERSPPPGRDDMSVRESHYRDLKIRQLLYKTEMTSFMFICWIFKHETLRQGFECLSIGPARIVQKKSSYSECSEQLWQ